MKYSVTNRLVKRVCEELGGAEIYCVLIGGEPWYKAVEVQTLLGYKTRKFTLHAYVDDGDKAKFKDLVGSSKGLDGSVVNVIFINRSGVKQIVAKSSKPDSVNVARSMGLDVRTKYLRKETEILSFVQEFLTTLNIPFEFQKSVLRYKIDLYLPEQRLAIEIDEFGHSDRDVDYETTREREIIEKINCAFVRFNPDEPNFKISKCIAQLTHHVFRGNT